MSTNSESLNPGHPPSSMWTNPKTSNAGHRAKEVLAVSFLFFTVGIPRDANLPRPPRPDGIEFGWQQTFLRDTCFFWGGYAFSGDYFHGLKRKDSPHGPIFRKGNKVLKYYPAQLQVIIRVAQSECDARGVPSSLSLPTIPDDFAASLRFRAEWKTGAHAEPFKEFAQSQFRHETREFNLAGEQIRSDVLEYTFNLDSHEIPLTDHLIVVVTDLRGEQLVRLSAFP